MYQQNMKISIQIMNAIIVLSLEKYSTILGFNSYKDAQDEKNETDFISIINEQLYLTTFELILNYIYEILTIKSYIRQFKNISYKEIAYNHLNKLISNYINLVFYTNNF